MKYRKLLFALFAAVYGGLTSTDAAAQYFGEPYILPAAPLDGDEVVTVIRYVTMYGGIQLQQTDMQIDGNRMIVNFTFFDLGFGDMMMRNFEAPFNWSELEAGDYRVVATSTVIDRNNAGEVADNLDYSFSVEDDINDYPNLVIAAAEATPDVGLSPGLNVSVAYTIANRGEERPAGLSETQIYYSNDAVFSGDDRLLRWANIAEPPLAAGAERRVRTQNYRLPNNALPGDRFLLIYADGDFDVPESREDDNILAAPIAVQPLEPHLEEIGRLELEGEAVDIQVQGRYAYIAAGAGGLKIVDVSEPEEPRLVGAFVDGQPIARIALGEGCVFAVGERAGMRVIDISNPAETRLLRRWAPNSRYLDIAYRPPLLYTLWSSGAEILNVANPTEPRLVRGLGGNIANAFRIFTSRGFVWISKTRDDAINFYNVRQPNNPVAAGRFSLGSQLSDMAIRHTLAVIAQGRDGLRFVNVANPQGNANLGNINAPPMLGSFNFNDAVFRAIALMDNYVHAATATGITIIDFSDLSSPVCVGGLNFEGDPREIEVVRDIVYVAGGAAGLVILRSDLDLLEFTDADFSIRLALGWNLISAPFNPYRTDIRSVFEEPVQRGNLLIVKDVRGRFYSPPLDFDNLPDFDFRLGYQVKTAVPEALVFEGLSVDPQTPIPLARGWNFVSYLPEQEVEAPDAFRNLENILIIAKDGQGRFYNPALGFNNLPPLHRGAGYMLKIREEGELVWE
ncbi:MAG: hypothetical protein FJY65_03890 [Calditrichaeota bacterium]|nr:hypothetical protein [Calditrichota bacterium]